MDATKAEIQRLLVDAGKAVAVFCPASGAGIPVEEYLLDAAGYGMHRLQAQFRQHVRRHAEEFESRELSWSELERLAPDLHGNMVERWNLAPGTWTDREHWAETCAAGASTPGLWVFGCLAAGRLAGYSVAWRNLETCHGVLLHRDSRFDRQRIGNVLLHAFSAAAAGHDGTATINLGRSWYPPRPRLDSFKRHAGYTGNATTLAVVLHPRIEPLLRSSWTHRCLDAVSRLTGGRIDPGGDVALLRAARRTELP